MPESFPPLSLFQVNLANLVTFDGCFTPFAIMVIRTVRNLSKINHAGIHEWKKTKTDRGSGALSSDSSGQDSSCPPPRRGMDRDFRAMMMMPLLSPPAKVRTSIVLL